MTTTSEKQTTIRLGNRETTWSDLLRDAVSTPGKLLEAYTAFHNFSVGNSLLASVWARTNQYGRNAKRYRVLPSQTSFSPWAGRLVPDSS